MKIMVIGAGAMGCLYGAKLALAGNDVTMVDVNEPLLEKLRERGIEVREDDGMVQMAKVKAASYSAITEIPELIIVFTKTMYSKSALDSIKPFIGPETYLCTLQNGLGNDEILLEYAPKDRIFVGITSFPGDLVEPGVIKSHNEGKTKYKLLENTQCDMLYSLEKELQSAGLSPQIAEDVYTEIWEKIALNAAVNTITAIIRHPCGAVKASKSGETLAYKIADEVIETAKLEGVKVSGEKIYNYLEMSFSVHGDHYPSMAQDVLGKRRTEVDSIAASIVKKASKHGLKVPYLETLCLLIHAIEDNYRYGET